MEAGYILLTSAHEELRPETIDGDSAMFVCQIGSLQEIFCTIFISYNMYAAASATTPTRVPNGDVLRILCWAKKYFAIVRQEYPYCCTSDDILPFSPST